MKIGIKGFLVLLLVGVMVVGVVGVGVVSGEETTKICTAWKYVKGDVKEGGCSYVRPEVCSNYFAKYDPDFYECSVNGSNQCDKGSKCSPCGNEVVNEEIGEKCEKINNKPDGSNFNCVGNEICFGCNCVIPENRCESDSDCSGGQVCSSDGECVETVSTNSESGCTIDQVSLVIGTSEVGDEPMSPNWKNKDYYYQCSGEVCDLREKFLEKYKFFIRGSPLKGSSPDGSSSCSGETFTSDLIIEGDLEEDKVFPGDNGIILDKYGSGFDLLFKPSKGSAESSLDFFKKAYDDKGVDFSWTIKDDKGKSIRVFGFSVTLPFRPKKINDYSISCPGPGCKLKDYSDYGDSDYGDSEFLYYLDGTFAYNTLTDTVYSKNGSEVYNKYIHISTNLDPEDNYVGEAWSFGPYELVSTTSTLDPNGPVTSNIISFGDSDGSSEIINEERFTYDSYGNLISSIDNYGQITNYGWTTGMDGESLIAWKQYPDGTLITFSYTNYNVHRTLLTEISDGTIVTEVRWNFDSGYPRVEGYFSYLLPGYDPLSETAVWRDYSEYYSYANCDDYTCGDLKERRYKDPENNYAEEITYNPSSGNPIQVDYCSDFSCDESNIIETWYGDYGDEGYLTSEEIINNEGEKIAFVGYERNEEGFLTRIESSEGITTFEYGDNDYMKISYPDGFTYETETLGSVVFVDNGKKYINVQDPNGGDGLTIDIDENLIYVYPLGGEEAPYVLNKDVWSLEGVIDGLSPNEELEADEEKEYIKKIGGGLVTDWGKRLGLNPLSPDEGENPGWEVVPVAS